MEKLDEIKLYINQSRDELEGGIWDGDDGLSIFTMLEDLQVENKQLQANLKKYGRCLNSCGSWLSSESVDIPCSCGCEQALKGGE